jgi:1,2-diacylglycerol 3-beta-glucosyltransferase
MSLWLLPQITMLLLVVPLIILSFYLIMLSVAACLHPDKPLISGVFHGNRHPESRFLILIPAHNEELLLGEVIRKLRMQSYPDTHYKIVVIADNCDDKTAYIARKAGATTLVRHEPDRRGKGQALNWAIRGHLADSAIPWDGLVIIDADSVLNPDFLWFMNERLQQGFQVMQAYYGVSNPAESWRTSLMCAALSVFHFLRPLGRDKIGLPCGLKGNGMCFARPLVERFGYPAISVVEDVELALIYLRHDIGVKFTPGAQVYGQMAATTNQANSQRKRWEGGRLSLVADWALPLWNEGWNEKNLSKLDGAMDLFVPPLTLLVIPTAFGWLFMLLVMFLHSSVLGAIIFALWSAAFLAIILYLATGLLLIKAPPAVWIQLSAAPLFIFWKISVYLRMAYTGKKTPSEWVRTERHEMKK